MTKKYNITPSKYFVLLKMESNEEKETQSGIILKVETKRKNEAIVLEVGDNDKENPKPCKKGDRVIFDASGSVECLGYEDRLFLVKFDKIVAITK